MAAKDKVRVTIEKYGSGVKLIVETEKNGQMVRNLEVETKALEVVDKRIENSGIPTG